MDVDPRAVAALSAGSVAAREPLARAAAGMPARELVVALRTGQPPGRLDPWLAGELARVIALQNLRSTDRADALAILAALPTLAPGHRGLYGQLALDAGDRDRTAALLEEGVPEPVATALRLDLGGPDWLDGFTGLLPPPGLTIADGRGTAFDRIVAGRAQRVGHPHRITTIVTTFRPGEELITAVRSLAGQTWTNHEILVVDDGSPAGHDGVLACAAALDPRVRILRLPRNTGTYVARNAGLDVATGEYVTFQDSDDWSHPLRLERQVAPLLADPAIFSTTSACLRVTPALRLSRVGYPQLRSYNLSSLMIRRERALRRVGRLDPIRKGADAEYVERARAVFGRAATRHLDGEALALIRLSTGSLSSPDYRPGWMHPARRSYRSAFQAWHRHLAAKPADATAGGRSFAVPRHLNGGSGRAGGGNGRPGGEGGPLGGEGGPLGGGNSPLGGRNGRGAYDVVLAGDWTPAGGAAAAGIGRLRALAARGLHVALLHLDALANLRQGVANLDAEVQDLLNAGALEQVELCDDVRARLVVARSAAVLSHAPDGPSRIRADRVVIASPTGSAAAARGGRRLFGVEPLWAPPGPAGRQTLAATPGGLPLAAMDLPGTLDAAAWRMDRRGPRADRPVGGRRCAGGRDEWRRLRDELPDPARIDVRLLDSTGAAERAFGRPGPPRGWLVYAADDVSLRSFLYQVDFYLAAPAADAATDADSTVLTAMAAGCVAVLPPRFAPTFGDAAVYCSPAEIGHTVRTLHARPAALREQSERGRAFVRGRHGHEVFAERVAALVG